MPYRAWLLVVALGLAISGSLLKAQEQQHGGQEWAQTEEGPSDRPPFSIPVRIIEDDESAGTHEAREEDARQREIDDLEAQQGMNVATQAMNEATQSMMWAAWVSTALVGLGTFLLIWTLWLTHQANRAAHAAVSVAREIGQVQVRAYLSADAPFFEGGAPGSVFICVNAIVKNAGQSPARDVSVTFSIEPIHDDMRSLGEVTTLTLRYPNAAPGEDLRTAPIAFNLSAPYTKDESIAAIVRTTTDWTDVFDTPCTYEQSFIVSIQRTKQAITSEARRVEVQKQR